MSFESRPVSGYVSGHEYTHRKVNSAPSPSVPGPSMYFPEPIPKKWTLFGALTTLIGNPISANIEVARASYDAGNIVAHGGLQSELSQGLNVVDHAKHIASLTNIFEFGQNIPVHTTELALAAFTIVGQYAHPTHYNPQEKAPSWFSEAAQRIHTILAPATTYLAVATVSENMTRVMTHQPLAITAVESFALPYAAFSLFYAGKRIVDWAAHPMRSRTERNKKLAAARKERPTRTKLSQESEAEIKENLLKLHAAGHESGKGVRNTAKRIGLVQSWTKSFTPKTPVSPLEQTQPMKPTYRSKAKIPDHTKPVKSPLSKKDVPTFLRNRN